MTCQNCNKYKGEVKVITERYCNLMEEVSVLKKDNINLKKELEKKSRELGIKKAESNYYEAMKNLREFESKTGKNNMIEAEKIKMIELIENLRENNKDLRREILAKNATKYRDPEQLKYDLTEIPKEEKRRLKTCQR